MNSENRILKIIWDKGFLANVNLISREAGFGIDYTRYILKQLEKSKLVRQSSKKDFFKISPRGKKRLEAMGVIEKKRTAVKKKKEIFRKKHRRIKIKQPAFKKRLAFADFASPQESPKIVLAHNLNGKEGERKLNVWSAIKKAAKYLSEISPDDISKNE